MSETAQDLALLRERVAEVFASHGLELWQLILVPDDHGVLGFHAFGGLADERPADDGFDAVIASARQAEADLRAQQSIDELTRRLGKDGGFL